TSALYMHEATEPERVNRVAEQLDAVRERVVSRIAESGFSDRDVYFVRLAVFHEDMHDEAFLYSRQTLGFAAPEFLRDDRPAGTGAGLSSPDRVDDASGDAHVPGGTFVLGASRDEPFVFDNEKWGHEVQVA